MSDESGFQISENAPFHYQGQVEYFMAPFVDALMAESVDDATAGTFIESGESEISTWFESAGLGGSVIEYLERDVVLPPVAHYVPEHLKALPWSGAFFELSIDKRAEAISWMDERLSDYKTDDGVELPFRSYLLTTVI